MNELAVVMWAREFVARANIHAVPVDLKDYVNAAGAKVEVRWNMKDNEAGYTIPLPDLYLICVNGNHREERQRFTVLHEIAHIILELPSSHSEGLDEESLGSYQRKSPEETLCDIFAAECLLPYPFFKRDVVQTDVGLDAVRELAEKYCASLTSTASRYAANSDHACAMVLSEKGIVRYVSSSPTMRGLGFWVDYGIPVPKGSVIRRLIRDDKRTEYEELPAYIWTNKDALVKSVVCEEACLLRRWNQGVSLLWFEEGMISNSGSSVLSSEDDDLLPELDGVLPWPSKRRRK